MIKQYFEHLYGVITAHSDLKVGLISGGAGGVSYKVGEMVGNNTIWEHLAHVGLVVSILVGAVALCRSVYSFRKEYKEDRAKARELLIMRKPE